MTEELGEENNKPRTSRGQNESEESAQVDTLGLCPFCMRSIPYSAKKCSECGSDVRGSRRYFAFSGTTLALLTALISVISSSVPAIRWYLEPKDARMHINYIATSFPAVASQNSSSTNLTSMSPFVTNKVIYNPILLASNDGTKSGSAIKFRLNINWGEAGNLRGIAFNLYTLNQIPIIVGPGQSVPFSLMVFDAVPILGAKTTLNDFQNLEKRLVLFEAGDRRDLIYPDIVQNFAIHADKEDHPVCSISVKMRYTSGDIYYTQVGLPCGDFLFYEFQNIFDQPTGPLPTHFGAVQTGPATP